MSSHTCGARDDEGNWAGEIRKKRKKPNLEKSSENTFSLSVVLFSLPELRVCRYFRSSMVVVSLSSVRQGCASEVTHCHPSVDAHLSTLLSLSVTPVSSTAPARAPPRRLEVTELRAPAGRHVAGWQLCGRRRPAPGRLEVRSSECQSPRSCLLRH